MKNRTTRNDFKQDERAVTSQGRVSKSRVIVLEALEAQGKEGATIDELAQLIGQDMPGENPKLAIGSVLSRMEADDYLCNIRGRWYLNECAPDTPQPRQNGSNSNGAAQPAMNGHKSGVAPFMGKRKGKTISVYTSPRVFEDAIALSLFVGERWFKIPLSGSARVCYGQEAPDWSPDQEMYSDVEVLKIQLRNGQFHEERPAPKDIVTILLEG